MAKLKILVRREILQLLSFKALLAGHSVQPIAWLALYSVGMANLVRSFVYDGATIRYLDFVLPGILALQGFNQFAYILSRVADEKRHGMFRAVLTSGIRPPEYVAAKASCSLLIVGFQCTGILAMSYLILGGGTGELKVRPDTLVLISMGTVFWANLGAALGTVVCSAEKSSLATTLLGLPVVFTGSVFYDTEGATAALRLLGRANPLTFYAGALRRSMLVGRVGLQEYLVIIVLTATSFLIAHKAVGTTDLVTTEK